MNTIDSQKTGALAADLRAQLSKLRRIFREQANPGDLSSSQIAVILRLEMTDGLTVSDLARLEGVRPQSMRNTVEALRESGHVEGRPDAADGRKTLISLTETCRVQLTESRAVWNDWLTAAIAAKLTQKEQDSLRNAVGLIRRLTED